MPDPRHSIDYLIGNTRSNDKIVPLNTNIDDTIPWSNELEVLLRGLYLRDDIADIFWGRRFEERNIDSTIWQIYVVTRPSCSYIGSKVIGGQTIRFIEEEAGFSNVEGLPSNSYDLLPTWKQIPQDLQMVFDEALENELGQSFRDAHYNLVGMSTGYKRTGGQFTTPAIILYVRQKGILRRGCDGPFPKIIRGFQTDVVEACLATSCGRGGDDYHGEKLCQRYQTDVKLGSSIGIGLNGSEQTTGTLGAAVRERNLLKRIGILSCEHVLKFKVSNSRPSSKSKIFNTRELIYQPSREDLLDKPKRLLNDLRNRSREPGARSEDFNGDIDHQQEIVDRAEKKIPKSELAIYGKGMRENFRLNDGKLYGIDAALGILVNNDRKLYATEFAITPNYFAKANLLEDTRLKGVYTRGELMSKNFDRVFKVGRTTGLTVGNYIPFDSSVAIDLKEDIKNIIKSNEEKGIRIEGVDRIDYQDKFIGYLKTPICEVIRKKRQECYPIVWFDRQMMIQFRPGEFECGDSGASVVNVKNGKALGLLHAQWKTGLYVCGIASPYFAISEALDIDICLTNGTIPL